MLCTGAAHLIRGALFRSNVVPLMLSGFWEVVMGLKKGSRGGRQLLIKTRHESDIASIEA